MAKYKIKLPENVKEIPVSTEELIDLLLELYTIINEIKLDDVKNKNCTKEELEELNNEYFRISQEYGKLRQEYGVYHFQANELFNRNTLTGFKLGSLKQKLYTVKNIWGDKIGIDYYDAMKLIDHFSNVYLFKKGEEKN